MWSGRTLRGQQDVGSAAVAQAHYLPATQEVQLLGYDGALAVPCSQAAAAVQPKHIHLSVERGHDVDR